MGALKSSLADFDAKVRQDETGDSTGEKGGEKGVDDKEDESDE